MIFQEVLSKSQSRINKLHPVVARATTQLILNCYKKGIYIVIVQGLRTIEEQNALYAQGRNGDKRPIVTNAKGGHSNHNFGVAIDFALLRSDGVSISWDTNADYNSDKKADWFQVVEEAKKLGFMWGGDWKSFKDMPHFEMTFGLSTSQYRNGAIPSQSEMNKIINLLDNQNNNVKEDDEEMTAEEKKAFQALSDSVIGLRKELDIATRTIADLTNSKNVLKESDNQISSYLKNLDGEIQLIKTKNQLTTIPEWAKEAVDKAVASKLIDKPEGGSYDFYRLLTVLFRKNLI